MLSPDELYPLVRAWLEAMDVVGHRTAALALAHLVTALLVGQGLGAAGLMRALGSPLPVPARQRYRRVARAWTRPWLTPAWLGPRLVRAALALAAPATGGEVEVVLDSVRCGRWEVFTAGVRWHGRVLPVAWRVLPYPWPRGRFTPTVCALLRAVAAAWPAGSPRPHLVADRGFPSCAPFGTLRELGWGWTIRLRARDHVTAAGLRQPVRALLDAAAAGRFRAWAGAAFGSGRRATTATLVAGRGLVVLPRWQRGPGSLRHRAAQRRARAEQVRRKHPGRPDASAETDGWLVLFTTRPTWRAAAATYRGRWATEGSYRDAQGGWDGRHGWGLERLVARLPDPGRVERLVGLWALGALVQTFVGAQVSQSADAPVRAVAAQWTATGRLSAWARGRFALGDPSGALRPWLAATLRAGADRLRAAPPLPAAAPPRRHSPGPPVTRAA